MFYFPGSMIVGRIVEVIVSVAAYHWNNPPEWSDDDRRGAGSLVIGLALVVGVGMGVAWGLGAI